MNRTAGTETPHAERDELLRVSRVLVETVRDMYEGGGIEEALGFAENAIRLRIEAFAARTVVEQSTLVLDARMQFKAILDTLGRPDLMPPDVYLRRMAAEETAEANRERLLSLGAPRVVDDPDEHAESLVREVLSWKRGGEFRFGVDGIDDDVGGCFPGEILSLTGAPGAMKTSLLLSGIERFLEEKRGRVLFLSLDMSAERIQARRLIRRLKCGERTLYEHIRSGTPDLRAAVEDIRRQNGKRFRLVSHQPGFRWTVGSLEEYIRFRFVPDLLAVDYTTLLKSGRESDLELVQTALPRILGLAKEFGIRVVLLHQQSRESRRAQAAGIVTSSSPRGGGIVEELSDAQIDLILDPDEDGEGYPRVVATVTKTRRGLAGRSYELDRHAESMTFSGTSRRMRMVKERKALFQRWTS
jgi:hypothetical protein